MGNNKRLCAMNPVCSGRDSRFQQISIPNTEIKSETFRIKVPVILWCVDLIKTSSESVPIQMEYCIYLAVRWSSPSRMTTNKYITPMKFCYNTKFCYNMSFTFPKQSQSSRSILQDGSRILGLFLNEKNFVL